MPRSAWYAERGLFLLFVVSLLLPPHRSRKPVGGIKNTALLIRRRDKFYDISLSAFPYTVISKTTRCHRQGSASRQAMPGVAQLRCCGSACYCKQSRQRTSTDFGGFVHQGAYFELVFARLQNRHQKIELPRFVMGHCVHLCFGTI